VFLRSVSYDLHHCQIRDGTVRGRYIFWDKSRSARSWSSTHSWLWRDSFFLITSIGALATTRPPSHWKWRAISPGLNAPVCDADPCYVGSLSPQHGASSGCGWRNGLQIWRLAANILNKQSWTDSKGWPSSLGVGRGVNNPSP
jgi:hypothetical protein